MKVRIFVSEEDANRTRIAFLSASSSRSALPADGRWSYVRLADTAEFSLPTAVDDEIRRCGFWVYLFGSGTVDRESASRALEPVFG